MDIRKMLRECGKELAADMGGVVDDTMAYEVAGSLLEDPAVLKAAMKEWPNKSKDILKEIRADYI